MADRITVNGVTYDGVDRMPPDARALYEKGLALRAALGGSDGVSRIESSHQTYTVNGQTYDSLDAMPPEARASFDETFARLGGLLGQAAVEPPRASASRPVRAPLAPEARPADPIVIDERDLPRRGGFANGLVVGLLLAGVAVAAWLMWGS
jgi:hypothetical protein